LEEVAGGERKAMMMVEPWVGAPLPCPTSPTAVEEVGGGGHWGTGGVLEARWRWHRLGCRPWAVLDGPEKLGERRRSLTENGPL
jgi:hypothetical protein